MKLTTPIALALTFLSAVAFAGKPEREFMKSELAPAVKQAEERFKSACGCALKITLNDSTTKDIEDMRKAKYAVGYVAEGAPGYCTDAESKKAVCQLKTLEVTKAAEATFTFKGGKGVCAHDGNAVPGWDMITREIDK